ncbi:hypothetical protein [Butyrivibrio sp. XPD2006]|uniref:hypothetical protein n=1 Tax=Butyrivibrio sp. XPD2006 TaxID=1280668 RepID=UPI0003B72AB5|nr:hypothetical protein [Butyrivibrio sp. XPD2006]
MLSYKTPSWKYKISTKQLRIFFGALFVLSMIPLLVLGIYDFPSADDFSMALQTHQEFASSGNIFLAVWAALKKAWLIYSQYEGYFFSIILTNLCPGAFNGGLYILVPLIILGMLVFGVIYFFDSLFVKAWKLDRDLTRATAYITLMLMIHCMTQGSARVEAFYWWSGAINYTFTFGMGFFWLGLLLRIVFDDGKGRRGRRLFWAGFWGFWLGGANYMSALELAICSVLILVILFMTGRGKFVINGGADITKIWIPAVTNLIGFACSCFTPGNLVRSAETQHVSAVKAVLLSIYGTFDLMVNDMARWEFLVALALLGVLFWKIAGGLKVRLEHPFMFSLFAFLLASSNLTPPFFAVGNIEAGRLLGLAWMEFVVLSVLVVFYWVVWIRQRMQEAKAFMGSDDGKFSSMASMMIVVATLFIGFGSALCVIPDAGYYTCTEAVYEIVSGEAGTYKAENAERLKILNDGSIKDAELSEYSVHPELLFYMDVTPDKEEWINTATATYFEKDSVILK